MSMAIGLGLGLVFGGGKLAPPWGSEVRSVRYINALGAGSYVDPPTGQTVAWAVGSDANDGLSVDTPWQTMANIESLSADTYFVFINASDTSGSGQEATHTVRLTIPTNVDVALVPVTNGAILKTGGTGQARCFDISNPGAFLRLRRGLSNAVFRINALSMDTTAANEGVFGVRSTTGVYGLEIDGPHSVFDSGSATVERCLVGFHIPTLYTMVQTAPTGTPTFIFKNGFKLVGETTYLRGVSMGHLGDGSVTIDGMDFAGTARVEATGGSSPPRDLGNNRGLFFIETANVGATVSINNTYGEFIPAVATTFSGIKIFDCVVTASNLAHKVQFITGASVKPVWFGGYNQANSAVVAGYTCQVTGSAATTSGIVFLAGDDGYEQPRLALSSNTVGAGRTCYAQWDFFTAGDVGRVVEAQSGAGAGQFTITAFVTARTVTVTVDTVFSTHPINNFGVAVFTVDRMEWRIGNKMSGGSLTSANARGPDVADSTLHGLFAGGCTGFTITASEIAYCAPGIAVKNAVSGVVTGNTTRNVPIYAQHLTAKAGTNCVFENNTCYLDSTNAYEGGGLRASSDDYGNVSSGVEFTANDIHISDAAWAGQYLFFLEAGSDAQMTGNHWIMDDAGAVPAKFNFGGSTGRTFADYLDETWVDGDY